MLSAVIVLSLFGILMVYDASVAIAIRDFGNQYYYVIEQAKWLIAGLVALSVFSHIEYHLWYKISLILLLGTMVLHLRIIS